MTSYSNGYGFTARYDQSDVDNCHMGVRLVLMPGASVANEPT